LIRRAHRKGAGLKTHGTATHGFHAQAPTPLHGQIAGAEICCWLRRKGSAGVQPEQRAVRGMQGLHPARFGHALEPGACFFGCLCKPQPKRKTQPLFDRQAAILHMDYPQILLQTGNMKADKIGRVRRRSDSPLDAGREFGGVVHAQACVSDGGRAAFLSAVGDDVWTF
jgi:hypothetical protein